ncbi:type II secretory pathway, pseudopilin PulG [Bacterioplanes sanyensis]|uniref:Type II secretory pathway, pseudopilin PulG n=1 Tax=Bacterioplanes sanyensis TaxID=1249553 RepID=A0A222FDL3_9GAMM|nr:type II secretion system protein [Bacterioplanes sanyensis]ASP37177.1 type II secretory pathway, pseudopilin PulG [Bacterioplanes sanyensis]
MKKQAGFTLIELIMVIVILGVLSAFALPRFADLGAEAREASLDGAFGAVRSAAGIVHAQFLAEGDNPANVTLEGATIGITNGYPSFADIDEAAGIDAVDFTITAGTGTTPTTISPVGAVSAADCQVQYTPPAAANQVPTIAIVKTNCN